MTDKEVADLVSNIHHLEKSYRNFRMGKRTDWPLNLSSIQRMERNITASYPRYKDIDIVERDFYHLSIVAKRFYENKKLAKKGIIPTGEFWRAIKAGLEHY
ncbi:hypothetical protein JW756_00140 [Candidatus Woesearchaeota archaeon]|nr:hypothetical protein [Candidatus Woesearchaeota archaeon]